MQCLRPTSVSELCDAINSAAARDTRLEIRGGGSKASAGAPRNEKTALLDMRSFSAIEDYSPAELVLTAGAATPLAEIETLLSAHDQMLAFEPFDYGALFGEAAGLSTLGGVIAAGVCGPRRLISGGARDHLLGVEVVSGRGERFVAGGKVVKNVTGYDLPKLLAGSWGRIGAITSITLKVVPRPQASATVVCKGLSIPDVLRAMADAMASPLAVGAAAHTPSSQPAQSLTLFRIEGFQESLDCRAQDFRRLLSTYAPAQMLAPDDAARVWREVQEARLLENEATLWRILAPPSRAVSLIAALETMGARWFTDWAGALIWAAYDGPAYEVRNAALAADGHANLMRGPEWLRATTPMLQPQAPALARLSERVRRGFDPAGVFENGRFLDDL
jgi:glycolate oxidase FAD binding subunit